MKYYCEEKEQVLKELSASDDGLRQAEAERRLEQDGKNRLAAAKGKSLFRRFLEQLADPMILILLAAAAVSGALAVVESDSFADVIIILAVVIINAILGVYQESKAEKAIEALQEMSAATSRVLRDGQIQTIPSEDLVKGDIILLEAGDAVPADARILESASLKVEEAALTGESVPVTKFIEMLRLSDGQKDVPLGDRKNMVYMGSTVVYGRGRAVVTATGMQTEMGKIADALEQAQEGQTPLQRKLSPGLRSDYLLRQDGNPDPEQNDRSGLLRRGRNTHCIRHGALQRRGAERGRHRDRRTHGSGTGFLGRKGRPRKA